MEIVESAALVIAEVAMVRRLVPQLRSWYVVAAVMLAAIAHAVATLGLTVEAAKFAGLVFVSAYGGFNGIRSLLEKGAKAVTAARDGDTIPAPPKLPNIEGDK